MQRKYNFWLLRAFTVLIPYIRQNLTVHINGEENKPTKNQSIQDDTLTEMDIRIFTLGMARLQKGI